MDFSSRIICCKYLPDFLADKNSFIRVVILPVPLIHLAMSCVRMMNLIYQVPTALLLTGY